MTLDYLRWSDEEIEKWVIKRFGPGTVFNRQLIKDLIEDIITRGDECKS